MPKNEACVADPGR